MRRLALLSLTFQVLLAEPVLETHGVGTSHAHDPLWFVSIDLLVAASDRAVAHDAVRLLPRIAQIEGLASARSLRFRSRRPGLARSQPV